jgi:NAD(P)H-hydrate epimerase
MKCDCGGHNTKQNVVTAAQMKEIERNAAEAGLSYVQMMENAGTRAAKYISEHHPVSGQKILIYCGRGNNGGDGYVAARRLTKMGASVKIVAVEGEPKTADAAENYQICLTMKLPIYFEDDKKQIEAEIKNTDIVIDAIFGTGFHGALKEPVRTFVQEINSAEAAVYALDIPSGVNGDSGEADQDAVRADTTIVFHRMKPAHVNPEAISYCGQIVCVSIGIED